MSQVSGQNGAARAVIEKGVSGQPHKGRVFVAVHAHLDDLPYFAGGLCSKLIAEGYTGYIVRATNDEHSGGSTNAHNILSNEEEHARMAQVLGFKDVFELYYRNDRMEEISKAEIRGRLLLIYRMVKADTVISFHPEGLAGQGYSGPHMDHLVTGRAAAEAASLGALPNEHWEHLEAGFAARAIQERYYFCASAEQPFNRIVDISPYIEKKIDAIAECKSQGGGNLGSQLRARLTQEGKRLPLLGNDDRTADREYIRHFLLDDYRDIGKSNNLQYAERFYYVDHRPTAHSKVDEYVSKKKNAIRI
ncbi:MAG TPA: PIG-L family deacetylase [Bryobacteraceae bacterium]